MVPPDHRLRRAPTVKFRPRAAVASTLVVCIAAVTTACTQSAASAPSDHESANGPLAVVSVPGQADPVPGRSLDEPPATRPATVAVVGDSITVSAAEHLERELADLGLEVVAIDAQQGRRMTVGERDRLFTGADIVTFEVARSAPDLWVVALGTNDIDKYDDVDEVAEHVTEVLARLPSDVPVVWVDTWIRHRSEQVDRVNTAIRSVVERRPGSIVVAWSDHAPADGVVAGDGVHLTPSVGTRRFAEVVAAGVESLIGPDHRNRGF